MRKLDDWILVTFAAIIGYLFISISSLEKADAVHDVRYQHILDELVNIKGKLDGYQRN